MKRLVLTLGLMMALAIPAAADTDDWPRESVHPDATILMYQPQIERLTENDIEARGPKPSGGMMGILSVMKPATQRSSRRYVTRKSLTSLMISELSEPGSRCSL